MEKSIGEAAKDNAAKKEISYEQLKRLAVQYQQKCVALEERVKQVESLFVRLEFLLRILGISEKFSPEFITACANEVETLMAIQKEDEGKAETEETVED